MVYLYYVLYINDNKLQKFIGSFGINIKNKMAIVNIDIVIDKWLDSDTSI